MSKTSVIAVHNGIFHADEVIACILYMRQFRQSFEIVRTRDIDTIVTADVAIDVGGIFDPDNQRFDHHQFKTEDDRYGQAAVSLVAESFYNREKYPRLWKVIDRVATIDTGLSEEIRETELSLLVNGMNPTDFSKSDKAFTQTLEIIKPLIEAIIAKDEYTAHYKTIVDSSTIVGDVLLLDEPGPWQEIVTSDEKYDQIKLVVFSQDENDHRVMVVPNEFGNFTAGARLDLPKTWAGLRGKELDKITGIDGCIFCHVGRFICGNTTAAGALAMAKAAIADTE